MSALPISYEKDPGTLDLSGCSITASGPIELECFNRIDLLPVTKFQFDPTTEESIKAARLHARVYASTENGYISPDSIDENGVMTASADPYALGSEYFYYEPKENQAVVARQIPAVKDKGIVSLPVLQEFECYPEIITEVAGVGRLSDIKFSEVVEISALASEGDSAHWSVVRVYSEMMRNSLEKGHKLWVMATDSRLTPLLDYILLGNLKDMGSSKDYMGSVSDPRCMNPEKVLEAYLELDHMNTNDEFILKTKEIFLNSLDGMNVDNLSPHIIEKMEKLGIVTEKSGSIRKYLKNNKAAVIGGAVLTGYAALRAVPLATVDEFHGSPLVFGALDVGTVPPYVSGLNMLYGQARSLARKAIGGAMASASFAAPYAYVYSKGSEYPVYVNGLIGAFVLGGVSKEIIARRRQTKADNQLVDSIREVREHDSVNTTANE